MATEPENPLQSVRDTICLDSKDYSLNHRDAWLYGITAGWGDCLDSIAQQHNWSADTVARLKRLNAAYQSQLDSFTEVSDNKLNKTSGYRPQLIIYDDLTSE